MAKKKETTGEATAKAEVSGADYVVIRKDVMGAISGYLQEKPYKETAGIINALGNMQELGQFLEAVEVK